MTASPTSRILTPPKSHRSSQYQYAPWSTTLARPTTHQSWQASPPSSQPTNIAPDMPAVRWRATSPPCSRACHRRPSFSTTPTGPARSRKNPSRSCHQPASTRRTRCRPWFRRWKAIVAAKPTLRKSRCPDRRHEWAGAPVRERLLRREVS